VSYTTQQTSPPSSLSSSSAQTSESSTSSSSASVTPASETTALWINISAGKPVSYYLELLESNGTQPYVQLARELRKLPDLKDAAAVAKIAHLALNATNPEVKEAFELMIKGGTPRPSDLRPEDRVSGPLRVCGGPGLDLNPRNPPQPPVGAEGRTRIMFVAGPEVLTRLLGRVQFTLHLRTPPRSNMPKEVLETSSSSANSPLPSWLK